ncbi:MAG: hypothetical protein ABIT70_08130 [Sulfuriferula sp.]
MNLLFRYHLSADAVIIIHPKAMVASTRCMTPFESPRRAESGTDMINDKPASSHEAWGYHGRNHAALDSNPLVTAANRKASIPVNPDI